MQTEKPDIRPDVNKEEKRSSGFWGGLFSLLGRNPVVLEDGAGAASSIAAGAGAAGSDAGGLGAELLDILAKAGFGGGLLATKAGLVALILGGGAIAGGVGFFGYQAMRQASGATAHGFWPFAGPHAVGTGSGGSAPDANAGSGTTSDSLTSLRAANAPAPSAATSDADQSALAANAAATAAAVQSAAQAKATKSGAGAAAGSGGGAPRGIPSLQDSGFQSGDWRLSGGSGGGPSVPGSSAARSVGQKAANLGAFGASRDIGMLAKSGARGLGTAGPIGAARQVNGEMTNPGYSGGTSRYDTASPNGGGTPISGAGSSGGGAGVGSGSGAVGNSPTAGGNPATNNQFGPVPTPTASSSSAAPWQGLLNMAMLMAILSAVLIFVGNKFGMKAGQTWIAYVCGGLAALLGIIEIALGASLGSGYGQKMMGSLFTLSGGLLATSAMMLIIMAGQVPAADAPQGADGPSGTLHFIMMASGALGVLAALGAYMSSGSLSKLGLGSFASADKPQAPIVAYVSPMPVIPAKAGIHVAVPRLSPGRRAGTTNVEIG